MINLPKKGFSGFALIELIVVMVIAVILASMAVPSFNSSVKNSKLTSTARGLLSEFEYARSEAVKRNLPVTICGSTDSLSCDTDDWESGRLVFVDDGSGDLSKRGNGAIDGEEILKVFGISPNDITIRSTIFVSSGFLVFSGDGSVDEVGTMVLCDDRGAADSSLIEAVNVSIVGQSRQAYDSDVSTDNIVNNVSGVNVTCI